MNDIVISGLSAQSWTPAAIGVIGAVFGALAAGVAAYYIEKLKINNNETEKRKQIYSKLLGVYYLLIQTYYSHGHTAIQTRYHYAHYALKIPIYNQQNIQKSLLERESINRNSPECRAADSFREKTEETTLRVGQINRELWETLGLVQISFINTDKLDEIISEIEKILGKFNSLIQDPPKDAQGIEIDEWKKNVEDIILPNFLNNEIGPAIEHLLAYLKKEIIDETKKKQ